MGIIKEKEEQLFLHWKAGKDNFIFDGVANEEAWSRANKKLLFLLREVNDCSDGFDERKYLNNYKSPQYMHSKTIDNVALWAYGLQKMPNFDEWPTAEKLAKDGEVLSSIALMNIKKSTGAGVVDWNNFEAYFNDENNQSFIRRQLEIYQADIVVCGGTAYYLSRLYPEIFNEKSWKLTKKGVRYIINNRTIYIDYVHPNVRAPKNIVYFSLLDAINEIDKQD